MSIPPRPRPASIPGFFSASVATRSASRCLAGRICLAAVLLIPVCGCVHFELPWIDEPIKPWLLGRTGWQVNFYTPLEDGPIDTRPKHPVDSWVRIKKGLWPQENSRILLSGSLIGRREGNYTIFNPPAGTYTFEYLVPHRQDQLVYGELDIGAPAAPQWAADFIRHTFLLVNPTMGASATGHPSILTEDDLLQAAAGDVVTKFVFIADLRAIQGRIDMIDQEIRQIRDLEERYATQVEYWGVKAANRRQNALYDAGYGEDTPGLNLASWQLLLGPEVYHWRRYTEADDQKRTYQQQIANLRLPVECLREERTALRTILTSARVLHRRGDLVLATPGMTRRYWDPVRGDVPNLRRTWMHSNPQMQFVQPYLGSQTAQVVDWPGVFNFLGVYPRIVATNTGVPVQWQPLGAVVAVMRIGPREPARLRWLDWPASLTPNAAPPAPEVPWAPGMGRRVPSELGAG